MIMEHRKWTRQEDRFLWHHGILRAAQELPHPLSSCRSRMTWLRQRGGPAPVPVERLRLMALFLLGRQAGYTVDEMITGIRKQACARRKTRQDPPAAFVTELWQDAWHRLQATSHNNHDLESSPFGDDRGHAPSERRKEPSRDVFP